MNNFKDKKTSLNTNIETTEPFEAIAPIHISVEDDNAANFKKMINSKIPENIDKDITYIAINEDQFDYVIGTIKKIEEWIEDNDYDPERQGIIIYELKSKKHLNYEINRTISIKLI